MHRACECEPLCSCLRPHYRQAGTGPASRLGLGRRGSAGSRPVTTHTRSCCHLCPKEEPPTAHAGLRGPAHLCDPPPPRSARLTPLPAAASSQWTGHWLFPPAPHSAGCDRPAGPRPRTGLLTALPAALPPTPNASIIGASAWLLYPPALGLASLARTRAPRTRDLAHLAPIPAPRAWNGAGHTLGLYSSE